MNTTPVPFTMTARVGDVTIEEVVVGTYSVNLYDDPHFNEIDRSPEYKPSRRQIDEIEAVAKSEARRLHQKDIDDAKIEAAE